MSLPPYFNKWNLECLQSVLSDYPYGFSGKLSRERGDRRGGRGAAAKMGG